MSESDFPGDEYYMQRALDNARRAEQMGEVPVGAVLVLPDQQRVFDGCNQPIQQHDPSAHAEVQALRAAGAAIENYRLLNSILYVTLEPCAMCLGAMIHARIGRLVYGADDPKSGAIQGAMSLLETGAFNHTFVWRQGVLAAESTQLLQSFFRKRRT